MILLFIPGSQLNIVIQIIQTVKHEKNKTENS